MTRGNPSLTSGSDKSRSPRTTETPTSEGTGGAPNTAPPTRGTASKGRNRGTASSTKPQLIVPETLALPPVNAWKLLIDRINMAREQTGPRNGRASTTEPTVRKLNPSLLKARSLRTRKRQSQIYMLRKNQCEILSKRF